MIFLLIGQIAIAILVLIFFNKSNKVIKSYEKRISDLEYAIGDYYKNSRGEI